MDITRETQFFPCNCGCNAIAVTDMGDDTPEIVFEVWEPRGGKTSLRYRLKQAWRVLRGKGASEETVLTESVALALVDHIQHIVDQRTHGRKSEMLSLYNASGTTNYAPISVGQTHTQHIPEG